MLMNDPFKAGGFGMLEMSLAMSEFPLMWGELTNRGIFRPLGTATPKVALERYVGTMVLAPTKRRGAPGTPMLPEKRDLRDLTAYHIPIEDEILPDDIEGVRKLGSSSELETATEVLSRRLQRAARIYSITHEWHLATTIRGATLDADNTTLKNFFTEYGVSEPVVFFDLDNASSNIRAKCMEVGRKMEDGIGAGDAFTGIVGYAGPTWFEKFVEHPKVKEEFRYQLSERNRDDVRKGFNFGNVTIVEYRASAKDKDGNTRVFIPADECRFVPLGTVDTFLLWWAPADFMDTVNTIGIRNYVRIEPKRFNRGWDIHTQTNPLMAVTRPLSLIKGAIGAS